jgi:hypothetical protein
MLEPAASGETAEYAAALPSGRVATNDREYEAAIGDEIGSLAEMQTYAISVNAIKTDAGGRGLSFGAFRVSVLPDLTYLASCIMRRTLHLKIIFEDGRWGMPMVEIHVLAFFSGQTPCFAIMNTGFIGNGWCQKFCMNVPKDGAKKAVSSALTAAGVGIATATIAAKLIAPILQKALLPVAVML